MPLEIRDVMRLLPHRYPFLLVDRVVEHEEGVRIVGLKNVTFNENFFPGHFPELPTMPGVLILEALAQVSGILAVLKSGLRPDSGLILYFAGIDNCRFKRPVVPGDQLMLHSSLEKQKRDLWKFRTRATVGGELATEADMMCVLKNPGAPAG
ncbi:MAG TPA: 3-hydroxyacyl-ACP dehydratase FabZ [Nevskiaceae bacterium]|nr:3-hydroxyacyl-ACP dehydratase FabZ [Nevskiaceae bacterium]